MGVMAACCGALKDDLASMFADVKVAGDFAFEVVATTFSRPSAFTRFFNLAPCPC